MSLNFQLLDMIKDNCILELHDILYKPTSDSLYIVESAQMIQNEWLYKVSNKEKEMNLTVSEIFNHFKKVIIIEQKEIDDLYSSVGLHKNKN